MWQAMSHRIAHYLPEFSCVVSLAAGEQDGDTRLVKQRGVIQTRAQSVKALGEIIQCVDDDRHLRPCERLANNPGLLPATDNRLQIIFGALKMVSARRNFGSFIMTSSPESGSRKKFPEIPCTAGGWPVTIDRLFGLVKLGTTQSARRSEPPLIFSARKGMCPPAMASSM